MTTRRSVLFVGFDRGGVTAKLGVEVAKFADVYLAADHCSDEVHQVFESVWPIVSVPTCFRPSLIYTTCEGAVPEAIRIGAALGVPYNGLSDERIPCDKFRTYEV